MKTIWDCRTHVRMTSMTSSVERTDLDFKISVALIVSVVSAYRDETILYIVSIVSATTGTEIRRP